MSKTLPLLILTALLPLLLPVTAEAQRQTLVPLTRLHRDNSPYAAYHDGLCSGLLQGTAETAGRSVTPENGNAAGAATGGIVGDGVDGFLQMPVVGKPLLIYIGEKDSTQYMAYASGYRFTERDDTLARYALFLPRYGVTAKAETHAGFVAQRFVYPDTVAEKGFLLDIDNAAGAAGNSDVDISFIDRQTIRAHKRGDSGGTPGLYYYARFSHPYSGYNVRREKVTLRDGTVTPRCRAVFYFDLARGEELSVYSAVSPQSSNAAYALVEGKAPARPLNDARKTQTAAPKNALAARTGKSARSSSANGAGKRADTGTGGTTSRHPASIKTSVHTGSAAAKAGDDTPFAFLEVSTPRAELRTALHASLARLALLPDFRKVATGADFLTTLAAHCPAAQGDAISPAALDSALTAYAASCMKDGTAADKDGSRAAWYTLNAIGFAPVTPDTLRLARPLFNVARLQLGGGRSLVLHTKNNSPANRRATRVRLNGSPVADGGTLPLARLLRGGIVEAKMEK